MSNQKQHPKQQLQSTLAAYEATARGLDAHPLSAALWRLLVELGKESNQLFRACGGEGEPFRTDLSGLDVWCYLRVAELEAALRNPEAGVDHVGRVSDWLLLPHLRERVQAVVGENKKR